MEIAKLLCERDENGNQLFPYLHSWQQSYWGDTLHHGESKDVAYLLDNREGIENFKVLCLGSSISWDSTACPDPRTRIWEKYPSTSHNNQLGSYLVHRIPNLEVGLPVRQVAQNFLNAIGKMSKNNKRFNVNCQGLQAKEDLALALRSFPNLAHVQLQNVAFPLGDLPVPPSLKKLIIFNPIIQLPSLETLSPVRENWQVTFKGTEMYYQTRPYLRNNTNTLLGCNESKIWR